METSSLDGAPRQTDVVGRATPVGAVNELFEFTSRPLSLVPGLEVSMCSVALTVSELQPALQITIKKLR